MFLASMVLWWGQSLKNKSDSNVNKAIELIFSKRCRKLENSQTGQGIRLLHEISEVSLKKCVNLFTTTTLLL